MGLQLHDKLITVRIVNDMIGGQFKLIKSTPIKFIHIMKLYKNIIKLLQARYLPTYICIDYKMT